MSPLTCIIYLSTSSTNNNSLRDSPISNSMTTSPGTSVPTLFGFSHPISELCGISSYAHKPTYCLYHCFLGTSTATLFGTALNRLKPLHCLRTALTSLPCSLLSATSLSARMHPTNRTLRTTRPVTGRVVRASCSVLEQLKPSTHAHLHAR